MEEGKKRLKWDKSYFSKPVSVEHEDDDHDDPDDEDEKQEDLSHQDQVGLLGSLLMVIFRSTQLTFVHINHVLEKNEA